MLFLPSLSLQPLTIRELNALQDSKLSVNTLPDLQQIVQVFYKVPLPFAGNKPYSSLSKHVNVTKEQAVVLI